MIRLYREDDLPILMIIGNKAWQGIYKAYREIYGKELYNIIIKNAETRKGEQIRSYCDECPQNNFVCEEDGNIVGFVQFTMDKEAGIGEIGNNAVDPDCGLKGIGQQLYKAVLEHFRKNNIRYAKVVTGTDEGHAPARRAYERSGFDIQVGQVTFYKKL
ncbi:MAG: GNAT family N-acetyltransferase [bacterium]